MKLFPSKRIFISSIISAGLLFSSSQGLHAAQATHGVSTGDIRSESAVIWSRTDQESEMHVMVYKKGKKVAKAKTHVDAARDYTGKIEIHGLQPDTAYSYKVWFSDDEQGNADDSMKTMGKFITAPKANQNRAISFAWGGDVAGQNNCRDAEQGFPIFNAINAEQIDFFIGLGDMIYADGICAAVGRYGNAQVEGNFVQAADMENYWAHWKYNREDSGYAQLLASIPYYAIWDDHEVVNDFGPLHDTRDTPPYAPGEHLLPLGLAAFLDYNAIAESNQTPKRIYRNIRWGKNAELFILDTRQYRDANLTQDSAERPKTMLGREQLIWLKEKLQQSDSTWKVIVSSVPMSIPTGFPPEFGRDGWANFDQETGFENELLDILEFMKDNEIMNVIFITTDVHFAEAFRYTPFNSRPDFQVHEFVTGPLNAGLFPNRAFDDTLGTESLFFYGPDVPDTTLSFNEAKVWMNYGMIAISKDGELTASIKDVDGNTVYSTTLIPQ